MSIYELCFFSLSPDLGDEVDSEQETNPGLEESEDGEIHTNCETRWYVYVLLSG